MARRQELYNLKQKLVAMKQQRDAHSQAQAQTARGMPPMKRAGGGASATMAPYEHPLIWDYLGSERYLQAAFCKSVAQLYAAKFGTVTCKNLSKIAAKGAFLGLLRWSKEIGCRWDESVLVWGASGGNLDILGWLLDNGCPMPKDASVCTAAAVQGHVDALNFLGLRSFRADPITFSAAAANGRLSVLQFAHRFLCIWDPEYVCAVAAEFGHTHILQWMYETVYVDGLFNVEKLCAVSAVAAGAGKIEVLKWLRSVGCPWDACTCRTAIRNGHIDILTWVMEEGCPWTVDDRLEENQATGLHVAVDEGYNELAEFLISRGANVNASDAFGLTPLSIAVLKGNVECVRMLVTAGADVNMTDAEETTLLSYASFTGHHEIAELLRAAGARE